MKKILLLLAGSPATGKTYLLNYIKQRIETIPEVVTPDDIKETLADSVGFDNLDEKEELELEVWKFYYSLMETYMSMGKRLLISEYPFSYKQKKKLEILSKRYDYEVVTVRLIADFEVLWERRFARDRQPGRHLSHLNSSYHFGDKLEDLSMADNHISKQDFLEVMDLRKYNDFLLGSLFEFDVTDYSKVDYAPLIESFKAKGL